MVPEEQPVLGTDDGTLQSLLALMAESGMEWPASLMGSGTGEFFT